MDRRLEGGRVREVSRGEKEGEKGERGSMGNG